MQPEPIAIIGTSCRFPGSASSASRLWDLLSEPRDILRNFDSERLQFTNFYNKNGETPGRSDVQSQAYLLEEDIRLFDASFFNINPKEAAGLDPQHRMLLETTFEAFESAGWPLEKVKGSQTSVHVGVMTDDYYTIQARDPDALGSHAATGLSRSILSNRVSYVFDLKGPSMTLDTACSSSLVALHLAVQGLRNGEARQAVVAGTNLLLDPYWFVAESSLHMLSPEARSRMWDEKANGYARGEGCAALIIKTLTHALRDGDSIECIIRETGVNSDGATAGLTMPSPKAQAQLIKKTYEAAGLDLNVDRCQYFECHGTGTQAGDPVEAQAIRDVFFPITDNQTSPERPLYCGSIKTVVGHLEGCAGIAGILKASLAIQHKMIPPNMHFDRLNPSVKPFYDNLCVPTSLLSWPETGGQPRRASVNSFGFGGTNAHAILESYDAKPKSLESTDASLLETPAAAPSKTVPWPGFVGPFVLSARSQSALARSAEDMISYLQANPAVDMDALASHLYHHRTAFPYRLAIPAVLDRSRLIEQMQIQVRNTEEKKFIKDIQGGILGVFTGQGAQAAQMGKELIESCETFRASIQEAEEALSLLPQAPSWSLIQELMADKATTRISEALVSQTVCCAVQTALVDLLHACGVKFSAVIGHSSGEIGAAYAAGILSRKDAMAIAYYRGMVTKEARGQQGQQGGMMAASMSLEDATELCAKLEYCGSVSVAASNSPSSVTLSGDADAIDRLKDELERQNIVVRPLRVDKAYHSHHMDYCAAPYLALLERLDIQIAPQRSHLCKFFSSVDRGVEWGNDEHVRDLQGSYWVRNMKQTVLFSEALESAIASSDHSFAMALEVGPHPALKGPVGQTLQSLNRKSIPYAGCLERNKGAIETFSTLLAQLWANLGSTAVDFSAWRRACGLAPQLSPLKNLPSYAWDHDRSFWRESRVSRHFRTAERTASDLLGRVHENLTHEKTWRSFLSVNRMPWIKGHVFQNQILFPGAGYVSLAVEAGIAMAQPHFVKLVEILDLEISKALVIPDNNEVELIVKVRYDDPKENVSDNSVLEASFTAHASSDDIVAELKCHGTLRLHVGQPGPTDEIPYQISKAELTPLSTDRFHRAMSQAGLDYTGPFRALRSLSRTWGQTNAQATWTDDSLAGCGLPHPALLDVAFQAGLGTFLSTAENTIAVPYLPVAIKRALIDPNQAYVGEKGSITADIQALMAEASSSKVEVDIGIINPANASCGISIEGLILKAISDPQPEHDRNIFVKTVWGVDCSVSVPSTPTGTLPNDIHLVEACERTALYYMRRLVEDLTPSDVLNAKWYHKELLRYIATVLDDIRAGKSRLWKQAWLNDDLNSIQILAEEYPGDVDIAMLHAVGANLASVIRGQTEMMEHMLKDGLLGRLYKESKTLATCNHSVAEIARQISHKNPGLKILEVGAGTGGTSFGVLEALGSSYSTYTFTDLSASFFNGVKEKMPDEHLQKVEYKVFNAEKTPASQGFVEGSYDVVIAANVLHATRSLPETVKNIRSLLRSGGHLIVIEVTGSMLRETGLMGGLEGWWLGVEQGRMMGPGISVTEWNRLLQSSDFSEIGFMMHDNAVAQRHSCSVFSAQATGGDFRLFRDPIDHTHLVPAMPLLIVGGKSLATSKLISETIKLLNPWASSLQHYESIDDILVDRLEPDSLAVFLSDLDQPLFSENLTAKCIEILQETLASTKAVLWSTSARMYKDPHASMMVGIGRALASELPHINFHFIDFDEQQVWHPRIIIEQALRLALVTSSVTEAQESLWALEQEVMIRDDKIHIPRIVPDHGANKTLNATKRLIEEPVTPSDRLQLCHRTKSQKSYVKRLPRDPPAQVKSTLRVEFSIAMLPVTDLAECYLSYGRTESVQGLLSLSHAAYSVLDDDSGPTIQIEDCHEMTPSNLSGIASHLMKLWLLDAVPVGYGHCLIVDCPEHLVELVAVEAKRQGIRISFASITTSNDKRCSQCIRIHPHVTNRTFNRQVPNSVDFVLAFTDKSMKVFQRRLPRSVPVEKFTPIRNLLHQGANLKCMLRDALSAHLSASKSENLPVVKTVNLHEASQGLLHKGNRLQVVLDWKQTQSVYATIQGLTASNLFSSDKTYLLVGMASELGQSLCNFMARAGARHIALASRNPPRDPHWIQEMCSEGVDIRMVKMDVTKRDQVRKTVAVLRETMPSIGGVANAALVFEAGVFINFSPEDINRQLKPKVDGTLNLDQEFFNDDLDFFLTFGSLATVCGNPGQAMYHAGNLFMASLVEQRRRRGQAASIINFGLLVDVGYVARMDRADGSDIEGTLRSLLLTPLSEAEFHHVVLQGIVSGRPDSPSGEVIMGMESYLDDGNTSARPAWVDKPFFSHMIKTPDLADAAVLKRATSSLKGLQDNLAEATNLAEVSDAVRELFLEKLVNMIEVKKASVDMTMPLVDLGLDSLNGIEIRQWLLNDLKVNLPLLKILGQDSVNTICDYIAERCMETRAQSAQEKVTAVDTSLAKSTPESTESPLESDDSDSSSFTDSAESRRSSSSLTSVEETGIPQFCQPITPASLDEDSKPISLGNSITFSSTKPDGPIEHIRKERASFAQSGIHFLQSLHENLAAFNVTAQYSLKGQLNIDRLSRAVEKALSRHDALNTCFFADAGSVDIIQHLASNLNRKRLVHFESEADQEDVASNQTFQAVATCPYDLEAGETMRVVAITHRNGTHTLIFGFHLIASDALSFSTFLHDLDQAYQMLPFGNAAPSYLDFAIAQHSELAQGSLEEHLKFWSAILTPEPAPLPLLPLAIVKSRSKRKAYTNHVLERKIEVEITKSIKNACQRLGITPMQFYLTILQVLLARLTSTQDVCIGVTDNGRGENDQFNGSIGHFANILPMRFTVNSDLSFSSLAKKSAEIVLSAFDNARVPFDVLLEHLGISRSDHTPLFQTAYNYRLGNIFSQPLGNSKLTLDKYQDIQTPYDLTINVSQLADGSSSVEFITPSSLYPMATNELLMDCFITLIHETIHDQTTRLSKLRLYSHEKVQSAILLGRGPTTKFSWPDSMPEKLAQVTAQYGGCIALKDSCSSLTYLELQDRVGLLAQVLSNEGIVSGSRVAVFCQPSVDFYVAMIAVLQLGALFVPFDITLPAARLQKMSQVCTPDILVFHTPTIEAMTEYFPAAEFKQINMNKAQSSAKTQDQPVDRNNREGGFLLFTSGSTGVPKAILLGQKGIMNYAAAKSELLGLGQVRVLQQTSPGFDMAIAQAFNALANGGTLVVAESRARGDPAAIAALMRSEAIEFTICTPTEYLMMLGYALDTARLCTSWKYACSGGEKLTERHLTSFRRLALQDLQLVDCYGPTELSCATTLEIVPLQSETNAGQEEGHAHRVGRAIANTAIYIVDPNGNEVVPAGVDGEICVSGAGVAHGYTDKKLSDDKFLPNTFVETGEEHFPEHQILYRTGDRGMIQTDGALVFLGRADNGETVIKLRGLRIDLEEIAEAILAATPTWLANAVVTVRGDPQFLVAHVVPSQGAGSDLAQIHRVIQDLALPRHMIPSHVVPMDDLPLNANGKVDRKALQALPLPTQSMDAGHESKLSVPEGELRVMWFDVLGDAAASLTIGPDSDFFTLGGSSLLLVRLQNVLKERIGVSLALQDMYQATTLKSMAQMMHQERGILSEDSIDWDTEIAIPESVLRVAKERSVTEKVKQQDRDVVLTGATSFFGGELLLQLIQDNSVRQIHCLAVSEDDRSKLPPDDQGKVIIYAGSLLSANLGLSDGQVAHLESHADQIIHAAVQGHCMNNYSTVKQALYASTKFLARMAIPRRVPFHLVSAPRVVLLSGRTEGEPKSMAAHPPPRNGSQGVTASKWASERHLEKLSEAVALPVVIHRHCALVGDRAPADDVMNSVVRFSRLSHKVPKIEGALGFFDFQDVEKVAHDVVYRPWVPEWNLEYQHHSGNIRTPFADFGRLMEQCYGGAFEEVSPAEWLQVSAEFGMPELLITHLRANMESSEPLKFPYLGA